jgi:hypothetical protein
VRNEEVLRRVKEERSILHAIKRRQVNWIGHILRRTCFPKSYRMKVGGEDGEEEVCSCYMTLRKLLIGSGNTR